VEDEVNVLKIYSRRIQPVVCGMHRDFGWQGYVG
jgi:hypothetical protein